MRQSSGIRVLIVTLSFWLMFPSLRAVARNTYYDSIELITNDADVVVRGVIIEIGRSKPALPQTKARTKDLPNNYLLRDRSRHEFATQVPRSTDFLDYYRFKAKIRVLETIKGSEAQEIVVYLTEVSPKYNTWMEAGKELLFSLKSASEATTSSPRLLLRTGQSVVELDEGSPGVPTMDFRLLTSREEILAAARDGARIPLRDGDVLRLQIHPPLSSAVIKRQGRSFNSTVVNVPVDARLETLGEKWAESPLPEYRCIAPRVLSHFKSGKHIVLLKTLLSDDYRISQRNDRGQPTYFYPVRASANACLREWGVVVGKPVIEEFSFDHLPLASDVDERFGQVQLIASE